jgi:2-amino-4-hydroxy-6-hydroxymethyldihydropteridine diphosphokinase
MGKKLVVHLGSNYGRRKQNIRTAIEALEQVFGPSQSSSWYETAAWGKTDQNDFINLALVFELERAWDALEILREIIIIETSMGRERFEKWGPRIIDIDILYLDREEVRNKILEIPHPLLQERRFVLAPLAEILPDFKHPVLGKSSAEMLGALTDDLKVCKIK